MEIIVQKFGGTSVANAEKIRRAAQRVIEAVDKGSINVEAGVQKTLFIPRFNADADQLEALKTIRDRETGLFTIKLLLFLTNGDQDLMSSRHHSKQ